MKFNLILCLLIFLFSACEYSKSVHTDLVTGLTAKGNGISCDDVYLSIEQKKIQRNTFIYGEELSINFEGLKGFVKDDEAAFPNMSIDILTLNGDTLLSGNDLYIDQVNGIKSSPLNLNASVTLESPLSAGDEYFIKVHIADKLGKGAFSAEMNFTLKNNERIKIKRGGLLYKNVILFSKDRNKIILDGKIKTEEEIQLYFYGLAGFEAVDEKAFVGMSLKLTDAAEAVILNRENLFDGADETGVSIADLYQQVFAVLPIREGDWKNPIRCEIVISDKKSDSNLEMSTDLILE